MSPASNSSFKAFLGSTRWTAGAVAWRNVPDRARACSSMNLAFSSITSSADALLCCRDARYDAENDSRELFTEASICSDMSFLAVSRLSLSLEPSIADETTLLASREEAGATFVFPELLIADDNTSRSMRSRTTGNVRFKKLSRVASTQRWDTILTVFPRSSTRSSMNSFLKSSRFWRLVSICWTMLFDSFPTAASTILTKLAFNSFSSTPSLL
mmetsp:Transcript_9281/g.23219  ORF Transcript_9281/g.23219 Transcript_9281/m.23219 type:complete len:214 (-) Transcript_9281:1144-1785(-)